MGFGDVFWAEQRLLDLIYAVHMYIIVYIYMYIHIHMYIYIYVYRYPYTLYNSEYTQK